jgi:endonuclease I
MPLSSTVIFSIDLQGLIISKLKYSNHMKLKTLILPFLLLSVFTKAEIPPGYYDAATGKTGPALKTTLCTIITSGHTALSYDDLWTAFQTTDKKADGKVWDMYSNCSFTFVSAQCGSYSLECDCYNREHSMPKSWFNSGTPMYTDLFHLVPTDGKVNGMRSNYPYGKVGTATYTSGNGSKLGNCIYPGYSGIVFEPIDTYKGDFARNYFYMATRYENVISNWPGNDVNADAVLQPNSWPVFEPWFLTMLSEWSAADPVSQKEIDRNNAVYAVQHNRNPYIDHPEYVNAVWKAELTATPVALSGFTYVAGTGPSASQSYTLGGKALNPISGNLSISGSANFEVSSNNSTFGSAVTIAYTSATLSTTVFVRLKSGLAAGTYSNELVLNNGGGATTTTVSCSGSVTSGVLPEPSNYPGNFSARNIQLNWTDATGTSAPTGYLIRMSATGFGAILNPSDGVPVPNSANDQNIASGIQNAWFTNLMPNTTYYFKLFGYTGSGSGIEYKTDGTVPQLQQSTGQ